MTNKCKYDYLSTVYEICPHCGEEIILHNWDVSKYEYQMFCPYCGKLILLCDECQSVANPCLCDWDSEKETCHKKKRESKIRERLKKELEKQSFPEVFTTQREPTLIAMMSGILLTRY